MNTTLFFILFGLIPYVINVVFVGFAIAYFIQKRGKSFTWFPAIPILMALFALNDLYIVPFLTHLDATFTIHNPEIAKYLGTSENESLTKFIMSDLFNFLGWFISSIFALGFSLQLTKGPANQKKKKGSSPLLAFLARAVKGKGVKSAVSFSLEKLLTFNP